MATKRSERPGGGTPPTKKTKDKTSDERPPAETCTICSEPATENVLECGWCECKQHSACLGISADQCVTLNTVSSNIVYFCTCCLSHLPAAMQSYENQTRDNERLQSVEQNVNQRLDAVEHKITEVIKSIESQLGKHHKSLSDAIAEQPTNISKPSSPPSQISEDTVVNIAASITSEQKEKEKRHLNIIVHNVEESSAEDGKTRKIHDIEKCKDLFQTYLGTSVTIDKAFRLGKRSTKPRLLKITLNSEQDKVSILKNKLKLRTSNNPPKVRNVFITPDYTPLEQKQNKALRQQLADMNKGKNTFMIKNGKIVRRSH